LIKTYGIHIYNNWFSKLTPVIDEDAKTIALKAPNSFVKQWVETNYRDIIRKEIENQGREFKGIIQQSTNQKVL
jgi:chromosomal replication initiation ATPase DnaA